VKNTSSCLHRESTSWAAGFPELVGLRANDGPSRATRLYEYDSRLVIKRLHQARRGGIARETCDTSDAWRAVGRRE
jgi:hypothetical protein